MANETSLSVACGTIVLRNDIGRALRKKLAAVRCVSVIDCCGEFRAGDTVNVTFRGIDGGQFAIAMAIAGIDAAALRERISLKPAQPSGDGCDDAIVIAEQDLKLLWPH
ncbi:MAG: hypothetical protein E6K53_13615 [Gammaproteobacteria bacterium]|nr:MAG: hypothetical protein E6K53_13615 [Gammaproteobacteria bacterium]